LREALSDKCFASAAKMIKRIAEAPTVTAVAFDAKHLGVAEDAFTRFGRGRHPAALNIGDCCS